MRSGDTSSSVLRCSRTSFITSSRSIPAIIAYRSVALTKRIAPSLPLRSTLPSLAERLSRRTRGREQLRRALDGVLLDCSVGEPHGVGYALGGRAAVGH